MLVCDVKWMHAVFWVDVNRSTGVPNDIIVLGHRSCRIIVAYESERTRFWLTLVLFTDLTMGMQGGVCSVTLYPEGRPWNMCLGP